MHEGAFRFRQYNDIKLSGEKSSYSSAKQKKNDVENHVAIVPTSVSFRNF